MKPIDPLPTLSAGAAVGVLGGLIGLGGAEFRLPLLIAVFGYSALPAVILNKAISLVVVASALPFRTAAVPWSQLWSHLPVILTLLTGSLAGAWFGADRATRLNPRTLHRVISVLLVTIALILAFGHNPSVASEAPLTGLALIITGVTAGFGIGIVAALLGVAGGELLIPTLVLLFGADIKLAGSLALAVSLPTMIVGFTRYSRDQNFSVIRKERRFLLFMAAGSLMGVFIGSKLLSIVPTDFLLPLLAMLLAISSIKLWRHG